MGPICQGPQGGTPGSLASIEINYLQFLPFPVAPGPLGKTYTPTAPRRAGVLVIL